jgi:hypothetical protein
MYQVEDGPGFHTKGYIFQKNGVFRILIGSSNLTQSAITINQEWNTKIVSTSQGEFAQQVCKEFSSLWDSKHTRAYSDFILDYEKKYSIVQKQREIAKQDNVISLPSYTLKPNSMQLGFIQRLEELVAVGASKGLLISATGTGKTYASAFGVRDALQPQGKVLFIVHRKQILRQAMLSYQNVFGQNSKMALLTGDDQDYDEIKEADFLFAMITMMSKAEVLTHFSKTEFKTIVIDAYGIIGLNSKGSANKGFLKLSPILFSPQMRLMIDLRRKHAQNEDLSAKRSAACNSGSTVSDVVPSRLLQRQSAEHTPDVDLHRSTVRYSKDVSLACAA